MLDRREFLGALGVPLAASLGALGVGCTASRLRDLSSDPRTPAEIAQDEVYWADVAACFPVDRSIINLNHAAVGACPAVVQQAVIRHLQTANATPPHTLKRVLAEQVEPLRERVAASWGVLSDEIAFTRNTSEGLQILQLGLPLQPGDEVITTTDDYPRMIETFRQRERRDGIVLKLVSLPVPTTDDAEVVRIFEEAIGPRTRLILICHMTTLTGYVLPVGAVVEMARARGVDVLVDGAQALAHVPFRISDLGCDFYATSLHKWLSAPHGTGLLYVRKERILEVWPLQPARAEMSADIRKFEEIGTHPFAATLAVDEALTLSEGIGAESKLARLVALRDRALTPLLEDGRVRLLTDRSPGRSGAIATVQVDGMDHRALRQRLWSEHNVLVRAVQGDGYEGIRVSPGLCTTADEVDRFGQAFASVLATS